jgi:hypothetical protein
MREKEPSKSVRKKSNAISIVAVVSLEREFCFSSLSESEEDDDEEDDDEEHDETEERSHLSGFVSPVTVEVGIVFTFMRLIIFLSTKEMKVATR